jgi:hypothetical protein
MADSIGKPEFPNTWADYEGNVVRQNLGIPFGLGSQDATRYPVAIQTTYSNPLMSNQRSCFTVHGTIQEDFETIFKDTDLSSQGFIRKYVIPADAKRPISRELRSSGSPIRASIRTCTASPRSSRPGLPSCRVDLPR